MAKTTRRTPRPRDRGRRPASYPLRALALRTAPEALEARRLLATTINELTVPTAGASPLGIASGPDGNLWFTENLTGNLGRLTTSGVFTEFPGPVPPSLGGQSADLPAGIAAGPDGALWFAESGADAIGRITTSGATSQFFAGITPGAEPYGITSGPDAALWFTEAGGDRIGRIDPTTGAVAEYSAGIDAAQGPTSITSGPDGNLWFVGPGSTSIGRVTPQGVITEYPGATGAGLTSITAGPDGALWFTEQASGLIGRIDPVSLRVTEFAAGGEPDMIAAGPDGALFYTESGTPGAIGRITTAGAVTRITSGLTANGGLAGIASGPDGNLYFAEGAGDRIGQVVSPQTSIVVVNQQSTATVQNILTDFSLLDFKDKSSIAVAGNFDATVDWGDGSPPEPATVQPDGLGGFLVSGTHNYKLPGLYAARVVALDDANAFGPASSSITVESVQPVLSADDLDAIAGRRSNTLLGSFRSSDPVGVFGATVDWGDGQAPTNIFFANQPDALGDTSSNIYAGHVYAAPGTYTLTVTVFDAGNQTSLAQTGTVTVAAPPAQTPFNEVAPDALAAGSLPAAIAKGPDQALWFTETGAGKVGRLTTAGAYSDFPIPGFLLDDQLNSITPGPDGALWFTVHSPSTGTNSIDRITTAGAVTAFSAGLSEGADPTSIVAGPDGNLWFTEEAGDRIGRITTAGVISEFLEGLSEGAEPSSIAADPDGNLYFAEHGTDNLGRITPQGVITEIITGLSDVGVDAIAVGADGDLYFTESDAAMVARITTSGQGLASFATPGVITPGLIADGPDGHLYFTDLSSSAIGQVDTAGGGAISVLPAAGLTANDSAGGIASGPDGNVYFAEGEDRIGQVVTPASGAVVAGAAPAPAPVAGQLFYTPFATFRDFSGLANLANFQAGITYDAATNVEVPASITVDASGTFTVHGDFTYARPGTYQVTVHVYNQTGGDFFSFPLAVPAGRLAVSAVNITANQGEPFVAVVADFDDSFGGRPNTEYTATIDWGDGTPGTGGLITTTADGRGNVIVGGHTYATPGPHTVTTSVFAVTSPPYSGSAAGTATVAASAISATGTNFSVAEGKPFSGQVASFTDSAKDQPADDYSAVISWDDGTTSAGTVVPTFVAGRPGIYGYAVLGSHTYSFATVYAVRTTITLKAAPAVAATANSSAFVNLGLVPVAEEIHASAGRPFTVAVATFPDPETGSGTAQPTGTFSASIDWGDGTPASAGTIIYDANSQSYGVAGPHDYARAGSFPIAVTVRYADGSASATARGTATVEVAGPIDEVGRGIAGTTDSIVAGPDGALWFTEPVAGRIGRVTTGGAVAEFSSPLTPNPASITDGPDGALWFTSSTGIGRITTDGAITRVAAGPAPSYSLGNITGGIGQITAGPDGNLWFTDLGQDFGDSDVPGSVDRLTPQGVITRFQPSPPFDVAGDGQSSHPDSITAGPDGALWFTDNQPGNPEIGRITTRGVATEFAVPGAVGFRSITAGPDGALWFTEASGEVGRITTAGVVTRFPTGLSPSDMLGAIATGPDGSLYFTDTTTDQVLRITAAGVVTPFAVPTAEAGPFGIATGSDRNLWFTELGQQVPDGGTGLLVPGAPLLAQVGQLVTPSSVLAAPVTIDATPPGLPLGGPFGRFADLSSLVDLTAFFTAGVEFGDGSSAPGTLENLPDGTAVLSSHAYAAAGTYRGASYLADAVGLTAPSPLTATIGSPTPPPPPPPPPPPLSLVVTNTNDSGVGSLRQAILDANEADVPTITFAIPTRAGAPVATIAPASPLPAIANQGVTIDGESQAAFEGVAFSSPLVEVDGRRLPGTPIGIDYTATATDGLIRGLSIFGFGGPLVDLEANQIVVGNYLGLRADGTVPAGLTAASPSLTADGVLVRGVGAIVGELGPHLGNVISGNPGQGVDVVGAGTGSDGIFGNIVGLDPTGEARVGNGFNGINVRESLGSLFIGPGNLVSGNGAQGIAIVGDGGVEIRGNAIGTDAAVTRGIGNAFDGILIDSSAANQVGGTAGGNDNIISGNGVVGVVIEGSSYANRVFYNLIGTDITGRAPIGNGIAGVLVSDSPANQVGPGDLISGNGSAILGAGVWIDGPGSTADVVIGDRIGTDLAGDRAIGNRAIGVLVNEAPGNAIGGTDPGSGNLISGNTSIGVMIAGAGSTGDVVQGNLIGTDLSGTRAVANGVSTAGAGLYLENAPGDTIGGTSPPAANVISGNAFDGVQVFGPGSTADVVLGNKVGTDLFGVAPLGNGDDGIVVNGAPGGQYLGDVVAANGANGFAVSGTSATNNVLRGDSIGVGSGGQSLGNGAFGILLANGSSGTVDAPDVNQNNALGPIRDTNADPAPAPKAATVTAKVASFGSRAMPALQGLARKAKKKA